MPPFIAEESPACVIQQALQPGIFSEAFRPLLKISGFLLAGCAPGRLSSAMKGGHPPPGAGNGYPCREFGEWLRQRALREVGYSSDGKASDLKAEQARLNHHAGQCEGPRGGRDARSQLLRADDVLKEWQGVITNVRARLLSLPSKLAARAYGARSRGDLQRLLQEGVNEALAELAGGHHEDQ